MNKEWKILLSVVLFALPFFVPIFHVEFDVATVVTVTSLFFAILLGFFIAGATSNYLRMQTLVATEDANFMAIYNYTCLIAKEKKKAVADAIDAYFIEVLEFASLGYADDTRDELDKVIAVVDTVLSKDDNGRTLYQNLHNAKTQLYATNQETVLTSKTIVSSRHWAILITLTILIILLALALRDGTIIWNAVIGVLFIVMFQTLILVHEVDSNIFLANQFKYGPPQAVFAAIGRLPYYPELAEKKGYLKNKPRPFRVGYTKMTKKGPVRTIKVIK